MLWLVTDINLSVRCGLTLASDLAIFDNHMTTPVPGAHCSTRQRPLCKHASSLRLISCLHCLAIVLPTFQHISPQISLPTTLRSPRATNTTVMRSYEDGKVVGPSTTALSDRTVVYGLPHSFVCFHICLPYQNVRLPSSLP